MLKATPARQAQAPRSSLTLVEQGRALSTERVQQELTLVLLPPLFLMVQQFA
jgi:hypothetical protein